MEGRPIMKKLLCTALCFISFFTSFFTYAGGGITHMFLAEESIQQLPDAKLRHLLLDNIDAYRVGAYYPDSGYISNNLYGEDSHWDPFIEAFADYINETYPNFMEQNPKLVAFLFGCAAHRVSDQIMHQTFYPVIRDKDFNGDGDTAHSYGDAGIDLLINADKNLWLAYPSTWWVPVKDLVNVYRRMGFDQYSADQIIWGNAVLSVTGYGERLISAPAYLFLQWKMPWTAAHYYDWPVGGITMDEKKVAEYQTRLWERLNSKTTKRALSASTPAQKAHTGIKNQANDYNFAENALKSGAIGVSVTPHDDGSVDIGNPFVKQEAEFRALLNQLLAKITQGK